jgi:hypothetical protein
MPTASGDLADATEVLLVVCELLGEPHIGAVNHECIGRTRDVPWVADTVVSRTAGSSVAAEKDVYGGTVLDDLLEIRIDLGGGSVRIDTVVRSLGRRTGANAIARGSSRRGGLSAHAGCVVGWGERDGSVRLGWNGGDGSRNGVGRERGKNKGLLVWPGTKYSIRNVAEEVIASSGSACAGSLSISYGIP